MLNTDYKIEGRCNEFCKKINGQKIMIVDNINGRFEE